MTAPSNVKPEDCLGFGFTFKGDGTLPKEAVLSLRGPDGLSYKSKSLRKIFENDAWQEVMLSPQDFTLDAGFAAKHPDVAKNLAANPDWQALNRVEFICTGPLMDQASVGEFGSFFFVLNRSPENEVQDAATLHTKLSTLVVPPAPRISVPFVADAVIKTDGIIDELAWKSAVGLPMNENNVPAWHFFGSHLVEGKRLHDEGANFWLLATPKGLALTAEIHKGQPGVFAEHGNWYEGDCVELFTDVESKGGKPTKQLFMAYRRPNLDRPSASDNAIQIGRTPLKDGYVLEALIPWKSLGFADVPADEFGLEFQIDYGQQGQGRALQMTYGTATNEAWVKADHYLKVKIAK